MGRDRDGKQIKHGRGDVQHIRIFFPDRPVGKKNTRHGSGVHAVVPAPGAPIVLENFRPHFPRHRFPGNPVTGRITDHKVGRFAYIKAAVYFRGVINFLDGNISIRRVLETAEFFGDFFFKRRGLLLGHNPAPFTAGPVEENPAQAHRKSTRAVPVHILKMIGPG